MTDLKKKQQHYKNEVISILNSHRYKPELAEKPTHQSWGTIIQGRFYMESDDLKNFMKNYIKSFSYGVTDFSILEIQKEYSPIIVDIDLKKPIDTSSETMNDDVENRLYDNNLIISLINKYIYIINNIFELDEKNKKHAHIYVFEKDKMQMKDDIYKDGIHIMFPFICANVNTRHFIRSEVIKLCNEDNMFDTYLENADKIIDKAVVSSNGWFLYGSRKPGGALYSLTACYDLDLNKIKVEGDIIKFLSLHYYSDKYSKQNETRKKTLFTNDYITSQLSIMGVDTKSRQIEQIELSVEKENIIQKACVFVKMLNHDRAENYEDWRNIGLALHNTDDSLLPIWIEFSSLCTNKFKSGDGEGNCEKFWKQFKNPSTGNLLTIRSLAYWAKQDNPGEYESYMYKDFKNILRNNIDSSTYAIAKTFYSKYSDKYICSSVKSNEWWMILNHRWIILDDASTIKIELSEEFLIEYIKERGELNTLMLKTTESSVVEQIEQKIKIISDIISRLKSITFKKKIIEEAASLFLDSEFESKLDSNPQLLGFENGVYDLEKNIFRPGRPDDYITMSTKNNYIKFSERMPYLKNILIFFNQILPNENVKNYFASWNEWSRNDSLPIDSTRI